MKKIPFTPNERKILSGHFSKVARKYGVSQPYVSYLVSGQRPIKSEKAKMIIDDLRKVLEFLKELNTIYQ